MPLSTRPSRRAGSSSTQLPLTLACLAAAAAVTVTTTPALAADRFWITPDNGNFSAAANWSTTSGGAGGASVPAAADVARFMLNNTYEVDLTGNVTNQSFDVMTGNVTFDLQGTNAYTLTASTAAAVGYFSGNTGRLTLVRGTITVDTLGDDVNVGFNEGTGFLTVSSGGVIGGLIRPDVVVGSLAGTGTVSVINDGQINANTLRIGNLVGDTGTVTFSGPQARGDMASATFVGNGGVGSLTITNGAEFSGVTTVGLSSGSAGTLVVSGIGTNLNASALTVGSSGTGTATLSTGSNTSTTTLSIGFSDGATGSLTVSGSGTGLSFSSTSSVGFQGEGFMTVSGGAQVTGNAILNVGENATGAGTLTVNGAGSRVDLTNTLNVGRAGDGVMTISAGGVVTSLNAGIGSVATGTGHVTVTGNGSRWISTGPLTLGPSTGSSLTVEAGGFVQFASNSTVNLGTTVTIDGGNATFDGLNAASKILLRDGSLTVTGAYTHGTIAGVLGVDGATSGDRPSFTLLGSGGITNVNQLSVGAVNGGELNLASLRSMDLGAGTITVGSIASAGSGGAINISSNASLTTTVAATVSLGSITVSSGGLLDVGTLQLNPAGAVNINGGTVRMNALFGAGTINFNAGTLQFDGNQVFDATQIAQLIGADRTLRAGRTLRGGSTLALNGSTIIDGGTVEGGLLDTSNQIYVKSGSINMTSGIQIFGGAGIVRVGSGASVHGGSGITNTGTIQLEADDAVVSGGQINNTGIIRGTGSITNTSVLNAVAGRISVTAGERLRFSGGSVANNGTISAIGGEIEFAAPLTNAASTGLISARDAIIRSAGITNNGGIAFSNGTVDVYGDVTQNVGARITVSNGGLANFYDDVTISPGAANVQATALGSTVSRVVFFGSYNGGVSGGGQAFIEGDHRPGNSPGLVTFGGDVAYGPFAKLTAELAGNARGSQYDAVDVVGTAALAGTLDLQLLGGFVPAYSTFFDVVNAGSITGTFDAVLNKQVSPQKFLVPIYTPTQFRLFVALPGDANLDGTVNFDDLLILAANYNGSSTIWQTADFNDDGITNFDDLLQLAANYNVSAPGGPEWAMAQASVPEPACLGVLATAGTLLIRRRGRGTTAR